MMELLKENLFALFKEADFTTKERVVQNVVMNCTRKELEMIRQIVDKECRLSDKAIEQEQEVDDRETSVCL